MGSWSAGVWGNDTAEDLKFEYQCAFYRYDPEEAVRRLDEYVRTSVGDESDTIEWCNYIYSLADFMWKKGTLTVAVNIALSCPAASLKATAQDHATLAPAPNTSAARYTLTADDPYTRIPDPSPHGHVTYPNP